MARVTVTFEDQEMSGGPHIEITVESDPPLPIKTITDPKWLAELDGGTQDVDMDRATVAQVAARMAVGEVAGSSKAAAIIVRSEK